MAHTGGNPGRTTRGQHIPRTGSFYLGHPSSSVDQLMVLVRVPSIGGVTRSIAKGETGPARLIQPIAADTPGCLLLVKLSHGRFASKIGRAPLAGQTHASYVTRYSRTVGVF